MRKILHVDCDCFYAAVEMRDNPSLANVPIAVGGQADQRGVIATSNYVARRYGVRSAMPTAHALRLCPQLKVIRPDFPRYRAVSREIQAIFHELTDIVEPLSLDEAYLDISDVERFKGSGTWMAQWLKHTIKARTGITVSVGVAPNRFLAKIASDWRKPDGLFVLTPSECDDFIAALDVRYLPGVGPSTRGRLEDMGITTCLQLREVSLSTLLDRFGRFGQRLYELARGIDERPVESVHVRKSISVETTYPQDIVGQDDCWQALQTLIIRLQERVAHHGSPRLRKLFVKIRFDDFTHTTMETLDHQMTDSRFRELFEQAWQRRSRPVRLLGVGVRLAEQEDPHQLSLFPTGST
ncbi:DNA polymerase IV [Zymobacter sp. IVIA_12111.31 C1]|uniref:DNA polymerase IV n=1 Tax=Zymobacter sp. IVIA_12111.31 C1 TaxID=3394854 RepID=UPI0039C03CED